MKLNKHLISSLAVAGFALCAAAAISDRLTDNRPEKVKPATVLPTAATTKAAPYPALATEGSADGIPYGLRLMGVSDRQVSLSWLSPEPTEGYFEDFESHDDFTINSPGSIGWQYIDADNANTYTWQACTFPNMGQKMAFIVMNPSQTTPPTDNYPNYKPYSGSKMLVDFCAINVPNNDFIVSPEQLHGPQLQHRVVPGRACARGLLHHRHAPVRLHVREREPLRGTAGRVDAA